MHTNNYYDQELLEVVDGQNFPIGIFARDQVHKQNLYHRSVIILVFNAENRLYLQKRSANKSLFPTRWDLSVTGHVQALESRQEAASRELKEELNLFSPDLKWKHEIPASPTTHYEFVTIFTLRIQEQVIHPNPAEVAEGFFVQLHELEYLVSDFTDLLTPALHYFYNTGLIFSPLLTDSSSAR